MKNFKMLTKTEMKKIKGGADFCATSFDCRAGETCVISPETGSGLCVGDFGGASGSPGGSNGNPCPTYCEPTGATIFCAGYQNGVPTAREGNCNTYPPDQVSGLHNLCVATNGNFWC